MAYKIPILVFFSSLQIIDTISLRLCCFESAGSRAQRRAASGTQSTPGPAKPVTTPTKASALVTGFDEKTTFQLARRRRRRPKNNLKEGKEWADEKYFVDWLVNHVKQYPSNTPWSDNALTVAYRTAHPHHKGYSNWIGDPSKHGRRVCAKSILHAAFPDSRPKLQLTATPDLVPKPPASRGRITFFSII